ncbi:pentatricopeptide repeat-containing protein At1g74630 [Mercurialis annua]|uniref:pentatricopeptide repeat-containing protein At1g74630 n=1 Tax=Mercurialis annua TaxID=3986 RepID=UPI00215EDFBC|nr:pentatricopeptide repeat-containing protein At1g74630 [Mercurialis annua]
MSTSHALYLSLLNSCKNLTSLHQFHANLLKTGLHADPLLIGKLLLHSTITLSGSLHYALTLFRHTPNPDVFMYNTIIRGLAESDSPHKSIAKFIEMKKIPSLSPDSFSFAFCLKAAANLRSLRDGVQLHCQVWKHGMNTHLYVETTLISMYGECECVCEAMKVFDEMPDRNVVAWNAVITACFRGGDLKEARELFDLMEFRDLTSWNVMLAGFVKSGELEMARGMFVEMAEKDDVSWSTMIVGFAHNGCFDEVFGYFRELLREGIRPNEVSLTGVLSACAQAGAFDFGTILHGFVEKAGLSWILSVNNALLDAYSKCGNLGMAKLVFKRMPGEKSIVSWTSMMAGLAMHGLGEEVIKLFHEMEESGTRPDELTFIMILYACSHAGLVDLGCEFFKKMRDVYNIKPAIEHYGCMVDLYGRCGQLQKAYEFVSQMPVPPNDIIWRTLLGACSIHGNVKLAELVKGKLLELDPNNSSDLVLLSNIYAVAGKWKNVDDVRRSMSDQRIKKTPGWSMIEVDKIMYKFVAGTKQDKITEEAYEKLKEIISRLRVERNYVPEVGSVLHDIEEEEKEDSVSMHSEKLAIAFGIARLCKGKTIRIVKNLRVCKDCHTVMKLISQVYNLEIVVRDRSRFHSFRNGSCSCRDYW